MKCAMAATAKLVQFGGDYGERAHHPGGRQGIRGLPEIFRGIHSAQGPDQKEVQKAALNPRDSFMFSEKSK